MDSLHASLCQVAFNVPNSWELLSATDTTDPLARCTATLRPTDWARRLADDDSLDRYSIAITVQEQSLDEALTNASFERVGRQWFVTGGAGSRDSATAITGPGWSGAYGITGFRCFRLGAEEVSALCDLPFAVLGTDRWSATVLGGVASEATVRYLLSTFRFPP
jgi:hypothetical protein